MTPDKAMHASYRHAVLVHDSDERLIEATRAFVAEGLAADADVLVHGTAARVALMRDVLEAHPRLEYGLDEGMYQAPTTTLFAYQRRMAERPRSAKMWVTGTVPLGQDTAEQGAWSRYESAVDEALADYPFVAMCTYDTRSCPGPVIAAALATHRMVVAEGDVRTCTEYLPPARFLVDPLAQRPTIPPGRPACVDTLTDAGELRAMRHRLGTEARRRSAASRDTIARLLMAVHEVVTNGLVHGAAPVRVTFWADLNRLTCVVHDNGSGNVDPMAGYRHPGTAPAMGLWVARQLVDDLVIDNPGGGCQVILVARDREP